MSKFALILRTLRDDESGQDLIEYSLLITFIAIACAALIGSGRSAVNSIWTSTNSIQRLAFLARSNNEPPLDNFLCRCLVGKVPCLLSTEQRLNCQQDNEPESK